MIWRRAWLGAIFNVMKRLFICLLLAVATLGGANAQVTPKEEVDLSNIRKPHFNIGIIGGFDRNYHITDVSYMTDYQYSKYAPGSTYGIQLGFTPVNWLTLRLDGVMVQKNYYRSHVISSTHQSFPDTTTNQYVNVPLALQLNVGKLVKLHAFGGGYVGYWLSSHRVGRSMGVFGNPEYDTYIDFDSPESQLRDNRLDWGFTYGAGLSTVLFKHLQVGAEIRWYYGMMDIQKPYMQNLNPRYNTTMAIQGGVSYWL